MNVSPVTDRPRISRTAAVGITTAGIAVCGALLGVLWAWIAPPIHGVVALTRDGERVQAYLGNESDHFFVAPFLIIGVLGVLAVTAAVLAWQWRAHRGPVMAAGLSAGLVAAAALAALVAGQLVRRHYGLIDVDAAPVSPKERIYYFAEAPPVFFGHTALQIAATLLLPAAVGSLVYAVCAAWTPRDDLSGYPAVTAPSVAARAGVPVPDRSGVQDVEKNVTRDDGAPPHR